MNIFGAPGVVTIPPGSGLESDAYPSRLQEHDLTLQSIYTKVNK